MYTLTLPTSSISVNHLYGKSKFGVYLKREGKEETFKLTKIICDDLSIPYKIITGRKNTVPLVKINYKTELEVNKKFKVSYEFFGRWLTLKNALLKSDVDNRVKFIQDIVCSCLNIDDRCFWDINLKKIHEPIQDNYRVNISIIELKD